MIVFRKEKELIIASYTTTQDSNDWVFENLAEGGKQTFNKVYTFREHDLLKPPVLKREREAEEEPIFANIFGQPADPIDFTFATLEGEYYRIHKGILVSKFDIYLAKDIKVSGKLFIAENDVSIFGKIAELADEDIYIGGKKENAIRLDSFLEMVGEFPNAYEKRLYAQARLSVIIKEHFASTRKAEEKFQKYVNKKATLRGEKLLERFKDVDAIKFQAVYDKILTMLSDEEGYNERQWQNEILEIILLLYPKYISVFSGVNIKADGKNKFLDFLLVDSNGHTDIIEIKKPFQNAIMTKGMYRNNYIPLHELAGTVMQIEKYIYYLNRWSAEGEKKLTEKYRSELPLGFQIKITNPGGLIIMGRDNNLSEDQKKDFEVVKRKYRNVVDIITYDDLVQRIKYTIDRIKNR